MSGLRFHPTMTLQAASRIAHEHGLELVVCWNGKQCEVSTIPSRDKWELPALLQKQAS
jgi:hypothetical protein